MTKGMGLAAGVGGVIKGLRVVEGCRWAIQVLGGQGRL